MRVALGLLLTMILASCEVHFDWSWNKDRGSTPSQGSAAVQPETRNVLPFESVQFDGVGRLIFDAAIPAGQIQVKAPADLLPHLSVEVHEGILRLAEEGWHGPGDAGVEFRIAPPSRLTAVHLSGMGSIEASQPLKTAKDLEITLDGLGRIALEVDSSRVTISQRGSGDLAVSGRAEHVTVRADGLGRVDVSRLEAKSAEVTSGGVGEVSVFASESLKVRGNGMGAIHFRGHPAQTDVQTEGLTQVKAVD